MKKTQVWPGDFQEAADGDIGELLWNDFIFSRKKENGRKEERGGGGKKERRLFMNINAETYSLPSIYICIYILNIYIH